MDELKEFCIPFSSLKLGSNFFNFKIENSFFEAFNYPRYESCSINLALDFRKENSVMDLRFHYQGNTNVSCDRCLDLVSIDFNYDFNCLIKFLYQNEEIIKDDIIYLPEESYEYNISHLFYEHFLLNFPKKVVHKKNECNPKQVKLMAQYLKRDSYSEFDPRWEKLKAFKKEI